MNENAENVLAAQLISGELKKGDCVLVSIQDGEVKMRPASMASQSVPARGHRTTP